MYIPQRRVALYSPPAVRPNFSHVPDEEDGKYRSAPQSHILAHVGTKRRALVHASFTESAVPCADSAFKRTNQTRVSVGVVDVYRFAMLSMRDGVAGGDGVPGARA